MIQTRNNRIYVGGRFGLADLRHALAAFHTLTAVRGYVDIRVDFSKCEAASMGPMLALSSAVALAREEGVDTEVVLPTKPDLARLFRNANWAHLLDPGAQPESAYGGVLHVPAVRFKNDVEQGQAVNRLVDAILSGIEELDRSDLKAIEWALGEITDNVLTHSRSRCGGLVQLSNLRTSERVEFAVSDAGVGIPQTMKGAHPGVSDVEALNLAVKEGVTGDPQLGQGNGLFGTLQLCRAGKKGYFDIHSGYARLDAKGRDLVHAKEESIPLVGTLVVACVDRRRGRLHEALQLARRLAPPVDYVEVHYEAEDGDLDFDLFAESRSLLTRPAGASVRTKLQNLLAMHPGSKLVVDLSKVPLCSSSFADEVFAKLLVALGPVDFMRRVILKDVSEIVQSLIDRAILQRTDAG